MRRVARYLLGALGVAWTLPNTLIGLVAGAVVHMVVCVSGLPHQGQDHLHDRLVVAFAVGADHVGLAYAALFEDGQDSGRVIIGMYPVADVLSTAVQLGSPAL